MKLKKLIALIAAAAIAVSMTACSEDKTSDGGVITSAEFSVTDPVTETDTAEVEDIIPDTADDGPKVISDREGGVVQVPDSVNTIVSTAPSVTEILVGLDAGSKIIAADKYSADVDGISPEICTLDFSNLNIEELTALAPDVIVINGMSMIGADDPYAALKDAGVNVIYVPTSTSIEAVKMDIEFLAGYIGAEARGAELISDIDSAVSEISLKAAQITEKKKVYFEIGSAPYLYTCGSGTFIDEIITLIGAENIYGGEEGWISNSEESVIAANPDVIVTNVAYDGYDFNEIKSRPGWENIPAVQNGAVYQVNSNATSRPSQHVVEGIMAVAEAVYPEIYS
ncbi:MAG: ABC transporter substrate-binding protein [Ruminococcus sp.]|nr:ABC transporter substrate-binding protein [Ruminococcus sp.]MCM1381638.1 ABC transporter substrate-binding protein [Muribaculaceae bacterium]